MEQRKEFIEAFVRNEMPFKSLCKEFGISEKTGHKWKARFMEQGCAGLMDQRRTPAHSPTQLDEDTVIRLIRLRTAHPNWGPKKLAVLYSRSYAGSALPSESSIYRVLGKAGLIQKRRIRAANTSAEKLRNRIEPQEPNDVWTVDFKGWWFSNRERCLPLTVRDLYSRYILEIRLMESCSADAVRGVFEELFRKYGLPKVIRSDNGIPFATTTGFLGLTKLSAWWMYLGILPDRTKPGTPTENGSHERMHADLSREIQNRIPGGIAANQKAIDLWAEEYNRERPHEALGMRVPADVYRKSAIPFDGTPEELEYPAGFQTRKINKHGYIKLNRKYISFTSSLRGLSVGLQPTDKPNLFIIWLGDFPLAELDSELACISPIDILK